MKQKLLEMVQVTVLFHTDEFIYVWSYKTETGAKTAPYTSNNTISFNKPILKPK